MSTQFYFQHKSIGTCWKALSFVNRNTIRLLARTRHSSFADVMFRLLTPDLTADAMCVDIKEISNFLMSSSGFRVTYHQVKVSEICIARAVSILDPETGENFDIIILQKSRPIEIPSLSKGKFQAFLFIRLKNLPLGLMVWWDFQAWPIEGVIHNGHIFLFIVMCNGWPL